MCITSHQTSSVVNRTKYTYIADITDSPLYMKVVGLNTFEITKHFKYPKEYYEWDLFKKVENEHLYKTHFSNFHCLSAQL